MCALFFWHFSDIEFIRCRDASGLAGKSQLGSSVLSIFEKLTKGAAATEFAKTLASEIATRYPAAFDQDPVKRPSVNRLTRIVEDACTRAASFSKEQRLGVIGKAKLGNALRWELTELGYGKEFIDLATEAVIVTISR